MHPRTAQMVASAETVEWIQVRNDVEAIMLEYSLIKQHRPRFNVILRDDKSYPYIYVSTQHKFPRLQFHRGARKGKGRYFGPYPSTSAVRQTLNELQKLFLLRNCTEGFFKNRTRPCLQHQIKRCTAPCVDLISEEDYAEDVGAAIMFLEGRNRDVIDAMAHAMSTLGLYIALVFFAAQFVKFFGWTNLGSITAVAGANFLQGIGLTGPVVFFLFILVCAFINLMLGSASAQWAVTAPIFVPMLMLLGYSPEVIQAAYRIGDSSTNIITPMMSYFGLIMAFVAKYQPKAGVGTLIAIMLPYSVAFLLFWSVFFFLWTFVLGLPVGPASPTYYSPGG